MKREYYYLIASLPELADDTERQKHPFEHFYEFCREELHPRDLKDLAKCFIFNDIENLCRHRKEDDPFLSPSFFGIDEFHEGLKDPDLFFPFMADFLHDRSRDVRRFPEITEEEELLQRFYETLDDLADNFVRDYYIFELHCRNICTALSHRSLGLDYKQLIIGNDFFSEQISASSAPDFGLGGEIGCLELLLDLYGKADPIEIEKSVESIRWKWLDGKTEGNMFSAEAVFAYAVKLKSVERWLLLHPDEGRKMLDSLIEKIKERIIIHDGKK